MFRCVACSLVLLSLMVSGCGPASATVSGQVTVDDRPLEKGIISFAALEGTGAPVTATIENGRYSARMTPGNKRVMISAPVVTGKRREYNSPEAPLIDVTQESLAAKYNSESDLTFEVKSGSNTKDWSLTGKKGKR